MSLQKLQSLRKEKNETLGDVAKSVGISTEYYWMIENGKRNLSYDLAVKISNHFSKKPDEIFLGNFLTNGKNKKA